MVKYSGAALDAVFSALADPTRRGILAALSGGSRPVSALAQPFDMSLPGFMKHLDILADSGLIGRNKEGRVVNCTLTAGPLREAMEWLKRYTKFWAERLDALERYLDSDGGAGHLPLDKEKQAWPKSGKSPRSRSSGASGRPRTRSGARSRGRKR
jgi:DNA-binding transcriptional ArsR family regulator